MEQLSANNKYTKMQYEYYENEGITGGMLKENHLMHDANPEYWSILIKETEDPSFLEKTGMELGSGCGRNLANLAPRMKKIDGVDIAPTLTKQAKEYVNSKGYFNCETFVCDGISLNIIKDETYDYILSTITLQHIPVYSIRFNYLSEFYRILKTGGMVSFQMGYGGGHCRTSGYYENNFNALGTNSCHDVRVESPDQIVKDLEKIGFKNIKTLVSNSWSDSHNNWIFVKAFKL